MSAKALHDAAERVLLNGVMAGVLIHHGDGYTAAWDVPNGCSPEQSRAVTDTWQAYAILDTLAKKAHRRELKARKP